MKSLSILLIVLTLLVSVANAQFSGSGSGSYNVSSVCPNGICEADESHLTCPQDCTIETCGNDACDFGETNDNCPGDCTEITCGDGTCDVGEICPTDCIENDGPGGTITIDVEYEFVKNGVIPLIPTGGECTNARGCPNFTKTMPISFAAKGTIDDLANTRCSDANCVAAFTVLPDPETDMNWDPFFATFTGERLDTTNLQCDRYHNLVVFMSTLDGVDAGWSLERIYINCDETITLNPSERRFAIGENNKLAFLVNVWNPTGAQETYDIEIKPSSTQDYVRSWLRYECGVVAPSECSVNGDILTVTVPAVDSRQIQLFLTDVASSRAGTYPINFVDSTKGISGKGTILVFAEGLSEFQIWQFIVLLLASVGVMAVLK